MAINGWRIIENEDGRWKKDPNGPPSGPLYNHYNKHYKYNFSNLNANNQPIVLDAMLVKVTPLQNASTSVQTVCH